MNARMKEGREQHVIKELRVAISFFAAEAFLDSVKSSKPIKELANKAASLYHSFCDACTDHFSSEAGGDVYQLADVLGGLIYKDSRDVVVNTLALHKYTLAIKHLTQPYSKLLIIENEDWNWRDFGAPKLVWPNGKRSKIIDTLVAPYVK